MTRGQIITRLLEKAAYVDAFGDTGEGDLLRQAAAMMLTDEITHSRSAVMEVIERLQNGVQLR